MTKLTARVLAARAFGADRFLPFEARGRLGWIRRDLVSQLERWPEVFAIDERSVRLRPSLATEADRTAAFAVVTRALADDGAIKGWRSETDAVRIRPQDAPLFHVERAAMRFFGFTCGAAHLNGFVRNASELRVWIARRSATKSIDPGLLDTLVGGGIASGQDAWQTLLRECGEEAGIGPTLARQATAAGVLEVCHEVPEGAHCENLYAYDLELSADFRPRNVDGEVAEFLLLDPAEIAGRIASGEFSVEAGLVTLDFLLRHEAISSSDRDLHTALDRCRVRP